MGRKEVWHSKDSVREGGEGVSREISGSGPSEKEGGGGCLEEVHGESLCG